MKISELQQNGSTSRWLTTITLGCKQPLHAPFRRFVQRRMKIKYEDWCQCVAVSFAFSPPPTVTVTRFNDSLVFDAEENKIFDIFRCWTLTSHSENLRTSGSLDQWFVVVDSPTIRTRFEQFSKRSQAFVPGRFVPQRWIGGRYAACRCITHQHRVLLI